jgi:hypothetical protein
MQELLNQMEALVIKHEEGEKNSWDGRDAQITHYIKLQTAKEALGIVKNFIEGQS